MGQISIKTKLLIAIASLLFTSARAEQPASAAKEAFPVEIFVTVPSSTPATDPVFLAGNLTELGAWNPIGLNLSKIEDGRRHGTIHVCSGTLIECKVTRGSWASVEKGKAGEEIPNRQFFPERGLPVEITVQSWAGGSDAKPSFTGDIRSHPDFASKTLGNKRDIWVYVPPMYEHEPRRRFPVLYLHDGQNVFNKATSFQGIEWEADETAERLIKSGKMAPVILVAVANTPARIDEYTPVKDEKEGAGGKGNEYARFLIEEAKPFIDANYRTLPDAGQTGICGSSLGGLISLFICGSHPTTFGRCGAVSPSIWWSDSWILEFLRKEGKKLASHRLWLDTGTKEGSSAESLKENLKNLEAARDILVKCGCSLGNSMIFEEVEGAAHNESPGK